MTICTQTTWFVAASLAYRLHRRLVSTPHGDVHGDSSAIEETKRVGDELTQACRTAVSSHVYSVYFADVTV
jgi:hypothetical protein